MRRVLATLSVFALVVASLSAAQPAEADIPEIDYVRTIGGPGHAGLYAWGMATAIDGTILVGDYNNYIVQRFETDGTFVQSFSGAGDGPGETRQPYSVAVNPNNGKIYVMDINAGEIEVFYANGTYDTTLSDERWSYTPRATVNSEGNIYVVDSHNFSPFYPDKIHVHDPDGNFLFDFGSIGSGPGQFGIIRGIAIGPNDEVFLGDSEQRFIHVFSKDGTFLRSFGEPSQFGYDMRGIVVDEDNEWVYVTDASNGEVEKYDLAGNHLMTIGQLGFGPGDLGGPRELTLDGDNNLYVADYSNNRVNVYDTAGSFIGEIPNPPQPPPDGGFNQPEGVAVNNATGDVYVSDTFNHRIQRFTSEGEFISAWGWRGRDDPLAMDYPRGVSIDQGSGTVWLNNTRSGDIKAYTANGSFVRSFGQQGSETNMFLYSRGIHLGSDGRLYVTDSGNLRLKVMNQFGDVIYERPCGTEANEDNRILMGCTSVTRDSNGNIYAAAVTEHRIYKWNAAGNLVATWGTNGSGPGQLSAPYGVAVHDGLLYVSEMWNNRISVFDLNGTYQGRIGSRGSGHGQFSSPTAITFDPDGNLYVSDKGNERIEVFSVGGGGTSNQAPTADVAADCSFRDCDFDGTGSSDPDGTIVSYDWDFGDGSTDSGATVSHSYEDLGPHTATLMVTDNEGLTATTSVEVTATNAPPVASFTADCVFPDCDFDATGSTDPDGIIDSYDWDFGDGTSATGASVSHTYDEPGGYDVTLTVTDNDGATDDTETAIESPPPVHLHDLTPKPFDIEGPKWRARLVVKVRDADGFKVEGVVITAKLGLNKIRMCTTNEFGWCRVKGQVSDAKPKIPAEILDVEWGGGYDPNANVDTDGDGDGETTKIYRPF